MSSTLRTGDLQQGGGLRRRRPSPNPRSSTTLRAGAARKRGAGTLVHRVLGTQAWRPGPSPSARQPGLHGHHRQLRGPRYSRTGTVPPTGLQTEHVAKARATFHQSRDHPTAARAAAGTREGDGWGAPGRAPWKNRAPSCPSSSAFQALQLLVQGVNLRLKVLDRMRAARSRTSQPPARACETAACRYLETKTQIKTKHHWATWGLSPLSVRPWISAQALISGLGEQALHQAPRSAEFAWDSPSASLSAPHRAHTP